MDGHVERDLPDLGDLRLDVVGEVALREQDDWLGAALAGEDQVPLEAAEVQVLVQRRDDEDDVEVRREHLLLGRLPRRLARELRTAGQDRDDRPRVLGRAGRDGDPVADDRQVGGGGRLLVEPPGDVAAELPLLGQDVERAAVRHADATGHVACLGVGTELLGQGVVPAERGERWHGDGSPLGLAEPGRDPARPPR